MVKLSLQTSPGVISNPGIMVCHLCSGKVILQGFLSFWPFGTSDSLSVVISNPGIRVCHVCRFITHMVLRRQVSNFKSLGCQEPCQGQGVFMLMFVEDGSVGRSVLQFWDEVYLYEKFWSHLLTFGLVNFGSWQLMDWTAVNMGLIKKKLKNLQRFC